MKHNPTVVRFGVVLLLAALLFFAKQHYQKPADTLEAWLFGEEHNPVTQAFAALSDSMEHGEGLGQAVQAFCEEKSDSAYS